MQSCWWLVTFLIALAPHFMVQEAAKYLIRKNKTTTNTSRKFLHIAHGVIYLLTWILFDHSLFSSQLLLAFIPFSMTIKILIVVYGIIEDQDLIKSLQRKNGELEIFGVAIYGILFCFQTIFLHTKFIGIYALICLCVGDGFASLFGSMYGCNHTFSCYPFNPKKSYIGLISFIISSSLFGYLFLSLFKICDIITTDDAIFGLHFISITIITAIIESCCKKYDNLIVFMTPLIVDFILK